MIIDVKTALDGCGEKCKAFVPVVAWTSWDGDTPKRIYRCEHFTKCRILADTIKKQMADNMAEAIKSDPDYTDHARKIAEFWEEGK